MTTNPQTEVLNRFRDELTDNDIKSSATLQSIEDLVPLLIDLENVKREIDTIVDLGCGYGALASILADRLDAEEVHGIDIDPERREVAESRGVETHDIDLNEETFPFDDESIDLVLSFGVLEHLTFYDHAIEETSRILRDDGLILFSVPNLGSWINRFALLLGNQPRDVEISQKEGFGISPFYPDRSFLYHIHSPTYSAFIEFLEYHGFEEIDTVGIHPYQEFFAVKVIDKLASIRPSLCRRIAVLGQKRRTI